MDCKKKKKKKKNLIFNFLFLKIKRTCYFGQFSEDWVEVAKMEIDKRIKNYAENILFESKILITKFDLICLQL